MGDDNLDEVLKVEKIENIHLRNLAETLEEVNIHSLAEECTRLLRSLATGKLYERGGSSQKAISYGQKPVRLGETEDDLDYASQLQMAREKCNEADRLLQDGLLEEARRSYEQAIGLNPDDDLTKGKLDWLQEAEQRLAEAQSKLRQQYPTALERGQAIHAAMQYLNEARRLLPSLKRTGCIDKVASEAGAALDSVVDDMLGVALGSKLEAGEPRPLAEAIATGEDVIKILDSFHQLDDANPKVKAALATAREQKDKLVAVADKLGRAAALAEEDTDQSLGEARDLLSQVCKEFPNEPQSRLLLEKVRDRYLELAEEAVARRDWRLAQRWLSESCSEHFVFLPSSERSNAIDREAKRVRRRARMMRGGVVAILLGAALFSGMFLLRDSADGVVSDILKQLPSFSIPDVGSGGSTNAPGNDSSASAPLLSIPNIPRGTSPVASVPESPGPSCVYDTTYGHNVCDEGEIAFKRFWQQHRLVLGPPITEKRVENGLTVQHFQNATLEYHPENPRGQRIKLSLLGYIRDPSLQEYEQYFAPQPEGRPDRMVEGAQFFDATKHYLGNRSGFRSAWEANGGLEIFGNPISEEFLYRGTGRVRQYFERAVFEYSDESGSGAVTLVPLGLKYAEARGWVSR